MRRFSLLCIHLAFALSWIFQNYLNCFVLHIAEQIDGISPLQTMPLMSWEGGGAVDTETKGPITLALSLSEFEVFRNYRMQTESLLYKDGCNRFRLCNGGSIQL